MQLKTLAAVSTVIAAVALIPSQALAQSLLIDDFTSGPQQAEAWPSAPQTHFQSGTMLGGVRRTYLSANAPLSQHQRPVSLSIPAGGPLILESGYQIYHFLQIAYGWNSSGQAPLNLDMRGYNRIRVWFDALDVVENFNILLWSAGGARYYQLGINVLPAPRAFCVDFPFDNFGTAGVPDADLADVDYMALQLQTGSGMGSTDFAVRSVSLIGLADVGKASCAIAKW